MAIRLNVDAFVRDYCSGVPDKDLLSRHGLAAKELVVIVKKLIQEGRITKDEYFDRNRKIQEQEARQERDFLKSLYHCPVCSHIQPIPFQECPACGHSLEAPVRVGQAATVEGAEARSLPETKGDAAEEADQLVSLPTDEVAEESPEEVPWVFHRMLGATLDSVSFLEGAPDGLAGHEYRVHTIVTAGPQSAMFRAEALPGVPIIAVKVFNPDILPASELKEVIHNTFIVQKAMNDVNILKILGTASVGTNPALVYEYMPSTLGSLVEREPDGVSIELIEVVLPQMLNALGYSHLHRGSDGQIRRLAHGNLKLSRFFFDEETQTVKLEGCGVWRALVEVRGHKRRLWEEPGIDFAGMAPEAFVLDSRSVNPFLADIYAMGAVLYRLTTGLPPFRASDPDEYSFAHLRTFPVPPKVLKYTVPSWLDAMILKCLEKEPDKRWRSATQMELHVGKDFAVTAPGKKR